MASSGSATFISAPARTEAPPMNRSIDTPGIRRADRTPSTVEDHSDVRSDSESDRAGDAASRSMRRVRSTAAETRKVTPLAASTTVAGANSRTSAVSAGPTVIPMLKFIP